METNWNISQTFVTDRTTHSTVLRNLIPISYKLNRLKKPSGRADVREVELTQILPRTPMQTSKLVAYEKQAGSQEIRVISGAAWNESWPPRAAPPWHEKSSFSLSLVVGGRGDREQQAASD